ncbi:MAG: hypothetical protein M1828_002571 [Chrysothrix sp. TS-e1954]|nr:MAG: hypothetical protein M1828_002571 [Chrysothrix sp. TS-e1954]
MDASMFYPYMPDYSACYYPGHSSDFGMEDSSHDNSFSGQSHYLEHGQELPTTAVTLEDLVVQKRNGKGKGRHTQNKSASASKNIPLKENEEDAANLIMGPEASPTFAKSMRAQSTLPTASKTIDMDKFGESLTNRAVLFDYPANVHDDGCLRYSAHSDGDVSAFQWSTSGLAWKFLGRLGAAKFEVFMGSLNHIKPDPGQDASRAMTPLTRHVAIYERQHLGNKSPAEVDARPSWLQPAVPYGLGHIAHAQVHNLDLVVPQQQFLGNNQYAHHASNELPASSGNHVISTQDNVQYSQDQSNKHEENSPHNFGPQNTYKLQQRQQALNQLMIRRNPSATLSTWQQGPSPAVTSTYNRPVLTAVRGTDGDHELRRTVANDPLRNLKVDIPPVPAIGHPKPIIPYTALSRQAMSKDDDDGASTRTGSVLTEPMSNPDWVNRPRALQVYQDLSVDTRKLTNDELRCYRSIDGARVAGPYFTGINQRIINGEIIETAKPPHSYEERLDAWWNSGRKDADRQQDRVKHILSTQGKTEDEDAQIAVGLFLPVHERLEEYLKDAQTRATRPVEYFARYSEPPEWCVDKSSRGAGFKTVAGGDEKIVSLFGEQHWGKAPQRIGRDPRYAPLKSLPSKSGILGASKAVGR